MSYPPLGTHDACGAEVRKLMSASAFSFKGSGFYITDYGGKSPGAHDTRQGREGRQGRQGREEARLPPASLKSGACATCPAGKTAPHHPCGASPSW